MTLWRIKDGIPSVADGLLVAGGFPCGVLLFIKVFDPFLDYFEPRGLLYLGYAILFFVFSALGGLGFLVFWRNQQKMREEIRAPRLVFTFAVLPLFALFQSIASWWVIRGILRGGSTPTNAYGWINLALVVGFALAYVAVVQAALRWPTRTTTIALWFNIGLGTIGVAAKFLSLFLRK